MPQIDDCPYCKSMEVLATKISVGPLKFYAIRCNDCGMSGPFSLIELDAWEHWGKISYRKD
jgi:hypothetical protein